MNVEKEKIRTIIIGVVITEKTANKESTGVYTFKVHQDATKIDVKKEVESLYGVKVDRVNILNIRTKQRLVGKNKKITKRTASKRALVHIKGKNKSLDVLKFKD